MGIRPRGLCLPIIAVLVMLCAGAAAADPSPPPNLLANGNFTVGSGNAPDHWRTEAWIISPSTTVYKWVPPAGGNPGEVAVQNLKPNDARWVQTLTLPPGWYHMSVDARAESAGTDQAGVSISVLEDGIASADLRGTTSWRRIGFYLKVDGSGADIELALRVGGFSSLNRGSGYFRNASVVAVDAPPPNAPQVFDLAAIRTAALPVPVGRAWSLVVTLIGLAGLVVLGWRLYGIQISRRHHHLS